MVYAMFFQDAIMKSFIEYLTLLCMLNYTRLHYTNEILSHLLIIYQVENVNQEKLFTATVDNICHSQKTSGNVDSNNTFLLPSFLSRFKREKKKDLLQDERCHNVQYCLEIVSSNQLQLPLNHLTTLTSRDGEIPWLLSPFSEFATSACFTVPTFPALSF